MTLKTKVNEFSKLKQNSLSIENMNKIVLNPCTLALLVRV